MFYRKNIYAWEQWVRIALGLALIVWGLMFSGGGVLGYGAAAVGLILGLTGIVGFCPIFAIFGRKLRDQA